MTWRIASLERDIRTIKERHTSQLEAVKDGYKKKADEVKRLHAVELEGLNKQLAEAQHEKEAFIQEIQKLKDQILAHQQEMPRTEACPGTDGQQAVCSDSDKFRSEIEDLKKAHASEIQALTERHAKAIAYTKTKPWVCTYLIAAYPLFLLTSSLHLDTSARCVVPKQYYIAAPTCGTADTSVNCETGATTN